jgi:hypothetical protein
MFAMLRRQRVEAQSVSRPIRSKHSTAVRRNSSHLQAPAPIVVQPKLEISEPDDPLERQADRVADEVMRMPESAYAGQSPPPPTRIAPARSHGAVPPEGKLLRACTECENDDGGEVAMLPKRTDGGAPTLAGGFAERLQHARSGGGEPFCRANSQIHGNAVRSRP